MTGSSAAMLTNAMAPSTPTSTKAARQLRYSPASVPRGIPKANAIVSPPVTVARALPRFSGAARLAATTAVVGVKTAAAHAATIL